MATKLYKGVEVEVISTKSGWTQFYDKDGVIRKARNSAFDGAKSSKPRAKAKTKRAGDGDQGGRTIGNTPVNRFESYERVKRESGGVSFDSGDKVARELRALDLDHVYTEAARAIRATGDDELGSNIEDVENALRKRYGKLNAGMQRMNLGNRIRGARRAA